MKSEKKIIKKRNWFIWYLTWTFLNFLVGWYFSWNTWRLFLCLLLQKEMLKLLDKSGSWFSAFSIKFLISYLKSIEIFFWFDKASISTSLEESWNMYVFPWWNSDDWTKIIRCIKHFTTLPAVKWSSSDFNNIPKYLAIINLGNFFNYKMFLL